MTYPVALLSPCPGIALRLEKWRGAIAQLVERCIRIAKVDGSIPFSSTILQKSHLYTKRPSVAFFPLGPKGARGSCRFAVTLLFGTTYLVLQRISFGADDGWLAATDSARSANYGGRSPGDVVISLELAICSQDFGYTFTGPLVFRKSRSTMLSCDRQSL